MGLNNKGLAIGAEISIQNENGIYETFRIRGNTYYKTLVAIGVAAFSGGALAPTIGGLVGAGALIPIG